MKLLILSLYKILICCFSAKYADKLGVSADVTKTIPLAHKIDHRRTVKLLIQNVKAKFPVTYKELREGNFVIESRKFVEQLIGSSQLLNEVLTSLPERCSSCNELLESWSRDAKAFFLTLGNLKEVNIKVKYCQKCEVAYYPDFCHKGLIFAHNKFLLSIEFILDILNCLKNSGCVIEYIKDRLLLLAKAEGLVDIVKKDIANTSVRLEKIVFAIGSLLVTEDDFDDVQCWFCGNCPKFVSTDGNTKVGVRNHRLIFRPNYD